MKTAQDFLEISKDFVKMFYFEQNIDILKEYLDPSVTFIDGSNYFSGYDNVVNYICDKFLSQNRCKFITNEVISLLFAKREFCGICCSFNLQNVEESVCETTKIFISFVLKKYEKSIKIYSVSICYPENDVVEYVSDESVPVNLSGTGSEICYFTNEYQFTYISSGLSDILGYDRNEFAKACGNSIITAIYPLDLERCYKEFEAGFSSEEKFFVELKMRNTKGNLVWLELVCKRKKNSVGNYVISFSANNFSRVKKAETEIDTLYKCIPGGIAKIVMDEKLTVSFANSEFYKMFKASEKSFKDGFLNFVSFETRKNLLEKIVPLKNSGLPINISALIITLNGLDLWVNISGTKIKDENDKTIYLCVFLDITETKSAQFELQKERDRYLAAIQNTAEIMFEYEFLSDTLFIYKNVVSKELPFFNKTIMHSFVKSGTVKKIIHPNDLKYFYENKDNLNLSDIEIRVNLNDFNPDGFIWVKLEASAFKEDGKFTKIIGTMYNIDKYKTISEKSRKLAEFSLFTVSNDFRYIVVINIKSERYEGYSIENTYLNAVSDFGVFKELVQKNANEMIHPDEKESFLENFSLQKMISTLERIDGEKTSYFRVLFKNEYKWTLFKYEYFDENKTDIVLRVQDIHHLRLAEHKEQILKQSYSTALQSVYEEVYQLNLTTDACFLLNRAGEIDTNNSKIKTFSKFRDDYIEQYVHEEDRQLLRDTFAREKITPLLKRGRKSIYLEFRKGNDKGEYFWVSATLIRVKNKVDKDLLGLIFIQNIDERKNKEFEKNKQNKRFSQLFRNTYHYFSEINIESGYIKTYSSRHQNYNVPIYEGYDSGFLGEDDISVLSEYLKQYTECFDFKNWLIKFKPGINRTIEYATKSNNGIMYWKSNLTTVLDEKNEKYLFVYTMDITEQKLEEFEKADNNDRLLKLMRNSYNEIFEVNFKKNSIFYVKADENGINVDPVSMGYREFISSRISQTCHPDDQKGLSNFFDETYLKSQFSEGKQLVYFQARRYMESQKDYYWHSYLAQPILEDSERNGRELDAIIFIREIQEAKLKEKEDQKNLRDALSSAVLANNAKSEFLSRMSHDIRTPMNAIIGMTNIAVSYIDNPEKVSDCLSKIVTSTNFLLSLINDILDMSKIESGKIAISESDFNIHELIDSIAALVFPIAKEKNINLLVEKGKIFNDVFVGDSLKLNQVILNIIYNALKFTNSGGNVSFKIKSTKVHDGYEELRFEIKDDGKGISPEFMQIMYDPFAQEKNSGYDYSGSGLGLPIAKNIVNLMSGQIHASSELNKGTEFIIEIPLKTSKAVGSFSKRSSFKLKKNFDFSGHRALLVEDNELNMEISKTLLEIKNLTVETAQNGQVAVEMFKDSPLFYYDIILMDIRMPVKNGLVATKEIRSLNREDVNEIPIIALTADVFKDDIDKTYKSGMNGYLLKPINVELLYGTIAELLL